MVTLHDTKHDHSELERIFAEAEKIKTIRHILAHRAVDIRLPEIWEEVRVNSLADLRISVISEGTFLCYSGLDLKEAFLKLRTVITDLHGLQWSVIDNMKINRDPEKAAEWHSMAPHLRSLAARLDQLDKKSDAE